MKFTKKLICSLLAVVICVSFGACAKGTEDTTNANETTEVTTEKKVLEYYEEITTLATMDSSIDATYTGKSTSSTSGETTKILYKYVLNDGATIDAYLTSIEGSGFTNIDNGDNSYSIIMNDVIVATVADVDGTIEFNIIPEKLRKPAPGNETIIKKGEKIEGDEFVFTLKSVKFEKEVKPNNISSVYTSYTADSGKTYIDLKATYYNNSKANVCVRDLPVVTADYNDGFTYDSFAIVDDGDGSFTWASSYVVCEPLSDCEMHALIEVPNEVESSDLPLFLTFTLDNGVTYRYNIR